MQANQRKPIAAGNWKLHQTLAQTDEFCAAVARAGRADLEIVIAPTALGVARVAERLAGSGIHTAAQNCYWETSGAFTGELSPELIRDAGASFVLVGHSERRALFGDTDDTVRRRIQAAQRAGLIPIFCIGETLQERESGQVESVLERQITYGLEGIEVPRPDQMVIAYEPVWAIGTGRSATAADADHAHSFIRPVLGSLLGPEAADRIRILYGGSVKPDNAAELCASPDVDGVLVGGASLKADSFLSIIEGVGRAAKLVGA